MQLPYPILPLFTALVLYGLTATGMAQKADHPIRTWTSKSGSFQIEAAMIDVGDSEIQLRKTDGKTVTVALDQLSKKDRDFIETLKKKQAGKAKAVGAAKSAAADKALEGHAVVPGSFRVPPPNKNMPWELLPRHRTKGGEYRFSMVCGDPGSEGVLLAAIEATDSDTRNKILIGDFFEESLANESPDNIVDKQSPRRLEDTKKGKKGKQDSQDYVAQFVLATPAGPKHKYLNAHVGQRFIFLAWGTAANEKKAKSLAAIATRARELRIGSHIKRGDDGSVELERHFNIPPLAENRVWKLAKAWKDTGRQVQRLAFENRNAKAKTIARLDVRLKYFTSLNRRLMITQSLKDAKFQVEAEGLVLENYQNKIPRKTPDRILIELQAEDEAGKKVHVAISMFFGQFAYVSFSVAPTAEKAKQMGEFLEAIEEFELLDKVEQ